MYALYIYVLNMYYVYIYIILYIWYTHTYLDWTFIKPSSAVSDESPTISCFSLDYFMAGAAL